MAECGDATTAMRHADQSVGVCSLRKTRAKRNFQREKRMGQNWEGSLQGILQGMSRDRSCLYHHHRKTHCSFQNAEHHKPKWQLCLCGWKRKPLCKIWMGITRKSKPAEKPDQSYREVTGPQEAQQICGQILYGTVQIFLKSSCVMLGPINYSNDFESQT